MGDDEANWGEEIKKNIRKKTARKSTVRALNIWEIKPDQPSATVRNSFGLWISSLSSVCFFFCFITGSVVGLFRLCVYYFLHKFNGFGCCWFFLLLLQCNFSIPFSIISKVPSFFYLDVVSRNIFSTLYNLNGCRCVFAPQHTIRVWCIWGQR